MHARIGAVAVLVILLTAMVVAQVGAIAGVVRDSNGGALPGVLVEVSSSVLIEKVRSTTTDATGRYQITALPLGTYTVTFSLQGFTTLKRENVAITADFTAPVNADLKVGSVSMTVQVLAEAPVVSVNNVGVRQVFRGKGNASPPPGLLPNRELYASVPENLFRSVADEPLSTFSIDVDTASYANVRRFLNDGRLPPPDAVRVEEMINYFRFDYPKPKGDMPFSITTELTESPWDSKRRLVLIGLQGREVAQADMLPRNLVFLIDVSGSMMTDDKLPLVRNAMRMLVDTLDSRDRVALVVYAGNSGLVLPSTPGDQKTTIHDAIARLEAGGSTNGGAGIRLAYQVARGQFMKEGVNRVVLATDGDFNVGVTNQQELVRLIEQERESGIFLSVLGVGTGNLKDSTMEMLADKGNGNYNYLDSLQEARKVLVREAGATLVTIAKDVKLQIEFNPQTVAAYRLIGYENRLLNKEDFNDDRKDAGEIGSGHSVTALYEIVPAGEEPPGPSVDRLKYQQTLPAPSRPTSSGAYASELMTVKLRYKAPDGVKSRLVSTVVYNRPRSMSANVGFASAVAEFGLMLRGSQYQAGTSFEGLVARARKFRGSDAEGYRAEFIKLAEVAASLKTLQDTSAQSRR
jgi:Ca-activated chloride channel family protein